MKRSFRHSDIASDLTYGWENRSVDFNDFFATSSKSRKDKIWAGFFQQISLSHSICACFKKKLWLGLFLMLELFYRDWFKRTLIYRPCITRNMRLWDHVTSVENDFFGHFLRNFLKFLDKIVLQGLAKFLYGFLKLLSYRASKKSITRVSWATLL